MKSKILVLLTDLDGTLTDGGRYMNHVGEEFKKFFIPDGMGLVCMQKLGFKTGIVTSEAGPLVELRAKQLKVDFLITGARNKLKEVKDLCARNQIDLKEVAFIGDDINDFDVLSEVGMAACPANAVPLVKAIPNIEIMKSSGGEGAVREFINRLVGEEKLLEAWRKE